jgi:hypothetical protein
MCKELSTIRTNPAYSDHEAVRVIAIRISHYTCSAEHRDLACWSNFFFLKLLTALEFSEIAYWTVGPPLRLAVVVDAVGKEIP